MTSIPVPERERMSRRLNYLFKPCLFLSLRVPYRFPCFSPTALLSYCIKYLCHLSDPLIDPRRFA